MDVRYKYNDFYEDNDVPAHPRGRNKGFRFSYKTWQFLEDLWPRYVRLKLDAKGQPSEAYKVMSVAIFPLRWAQRMAKKEGHPLGLEDILLLFWIQRVEEARENVGAMDYDIGVPLSWGKGLTHKKEHRLIKAGLIEFYPGNLRVVRVTAQGKVLMAQMMEHVEKAHREVKDYVKAQPPWYQELCEKFMSRFTTVWKQLDL